MIKLPINSRVASRFNQLMNVELQEFELNLVIIFEDNHLITENFPIKLIRSTLQPINSQ